jgi:hypothetical protein
MNATLSSKGRDCRKNPLQNQTAFVSASGTGNDSTSAR